MDTFVKGIDLLIEIHISKIVVKVKVKVWLWKP